MKKLMIPIIFGLVVCMQPMDLFAKTICFAGGGGAEGTHFVFSGGKVDLKPFSGSWILSGLCNVPAWAVIVKDAAGIHYITINMAHGAPSGTCRSAWFYASGPTTLSMSGDYDLYQDGTFDNAFTLAEVSCSSVPTATPENDS